MINMVKQLIAYPLCVYDNELGRNSLSFIGTVIGRKTFIQYYK